MPKTITIRPLCCGYIRVSPSVLYGNDVNLRHSAHQIFARDEGRVVLPVYAFLVEHPQGRFLIDTGFPREMSPKGAYDPKAVSALLPKHLAQFYRPWVPQGMAITEQLESLGINPSDLDCVILHRRSQVPEGSEARHRRGGRVFLDLPHGLPRAPAAAVLSGRPDGALLVQGQRRRPQPLGI